MVSSRQSASSFHRLRSPFPTTNAGSRRTVLGALTHMFHATAEKSSSCGSGRTGRENGATHGSSFSSKPCRRARCHGARVAAPADAQRRRRQCLSFDRKPKACALPRLTASRKRARTTCLPLSPSFGSAHAFGLRSNEGRTGRTVPPIVRRRSGCGGGTACRAAKALGLFEILPLQLALRRGSGVLQWAAFYGSDGLPTNAATSKSANP